MRRPWQLQIADCRLPITDQVGCRIWIYLLVQLFANHAHWRGVAAGQALNKFDAVSSVGAEGEWNKHFFTITLALHFTTRQQILHQFDSPSHPASQRASDP